MRFSFGNYFIPGLWVFLFATENQLPFFFWISHTYWFIATKKLSEEYEVVLGLSWERVLDVSTEQILLYCIAQFVHHAHTHCERLLKAALTPNEVSANWRINAVKFPCFLMSFWKDTEQRKKFRWYGKFWLKWRGNSLEDTESLLHKVYEKLFATKVKTHKNEIPVDTTILTFLFSF